MKRSLVMLAIVPLIASACTLRYTHARFDDQALTNQTKGVPLQGGLVFLGRNHPIGRTDFQLLGGRQEFSSAPQTVLYNVELSFRYFPVRGSPIRPYAGIGAGRHQFFIEETFSTCPPGYICFPGIGNDFKETRRENLATGYHTFWMFGAELGARRAKGAIVVEATREFSARQADFDFRGWRFAAGLVIRGF